MTTAVPMNTGAGSGVTEALSSDHDRLDALENHAFERFASGDVGGAKVAWAEFTAGLLRHIRFEEDVLFPVFEEKTGFPATHGPTRVMRIEHREIERLLERIGRAFDDRGAALDLRQELLRVLGDHNMKEERILYPGTDERLDRDEREALVTRFQAF